MYTIKLTRIKTKEFMELTYTNHRAMGLLANLLQDADHVRTALANSRKPDGYSVDLINPSYQGFSLLVKHC